MKKVAEVAAVFFLILCSFGLGVVFATYNHFGSPIVTVELENISSQKITSAALNHESGSVVVKDINSHSSRLVHFYTPGESSYRLQVTFEDGHVISSEGAYVEAGYHIQEKINESSIQTNTKLFSYEP